ncbi:uncharacterized protein LOC129764162 [Toxorhynchites rutilus septentrionalis]|uniref:uncharacterized protein LOC129764162 n=1 Tax=Toxorhynchites rutilus septentrionalis TaxID=329112 RepID=UPI00247A133E|nr:uncharacterized protein LOC129764162 [Toxorhynchites rutilus septentrionalis]
MNVADDATKWGEGPCLEESGRWFSGPPFLWKPEEKWPKQKKCIESTDEELRACYMHHEVQNLQNPITLARFSKWTRLLRTTAYVIRFVDRLKRQESGRKNGTNLTQEELHAAEVLLWKLAQSEAYRDEVVIFAKNKTLPEVERLELDKSSSLWRLTPMMDEQGVLRVDGRITKAKNVYEDVKFPVILPRNHRITALITESYHQKFLHDNSETIINEMRQRFYIAQLRTVARKVTERCQWCKVFKAKPAVPRMGPLPVARLSPNIRPFTYIGVDYFGPIQIKVGRSSVKRWICLITCLTVRAVHLEVAYDLSTKSCIACLRRFVCRRGAPLEIYSDNGRNFSGADRVLRDQIQQIEQHLASTFTNTETKWLFIPPSAPHMGGSWERMVRSIKKTMASLPQNPKLDDDGLQTLIVEAEAIVNTRPLTYLPLDSAEQEALTPNHFILGSSTGVKQPVVKITTETIRTSWDLIIQRIDYFWKRWVLEYLPTLTRRTKWFNETKPIQCGDLVIVIDETRRNRWIRGRVLQVITGSDKRVRQALVQTQGGLFRRPVSKLAVLDVAKCSEPEGSIQPHEEGNVATIAVNLPM